MSSSSWFDYNKTNGIATSSFTDVDSCVIVALFSKASNKCLDYAIIDILSDGEKGDPGNPGNDSIILQSKNGNSHIFYLNPSGHLLQET
jgi:hypothetical protein